MGIVIHGYACHSAIGATADYWTALTSKRRPERAVWTPQPGESSHALLLRFLLASWNEIRAKLPHDWSAGKKLGVILASTKGAIDDSVWNPGFERRETDTLTPLFHDFIQRAELNPVESICVSNACASSLSALQLASHWVAQNRADSVLILACDRVGPFIEKGFASLKALAAGESRPFSADRDGLRLGDAAAAVLVGRRNPLATEPMLEIDAIGIDAEGYAVTRPSPSGESLKRAYFRAVSSAHATTLNPDLIIAHGTGTVLNDLSEDRAYAELFPAGETPITGTKWCVGHSLGASGAMDLIAACQVLRTQTAFSIATTAERDPSFRARYLTAGASLPSSFRRVMISSLGFGGIHAVASVVLRTAPVLHEFNFTFKHPAETEPAWAPKVDRWYQLDAAAYGLAEFYQTHREKLGAPPSMIFLASASASNETDGQFAATGAASPGKFVHTLPNIRLSPLCQVMGWTGPTLCLQNGAATWESAVHEARTWVSTAMPRVWVLGVHANTVRCAVLTHEGEPV